MSRAPRDPIGRRKAIVDAALELILDTGINKITHRKIAERAGVPLGSTTQYFDSLEDLLSAALEQLSASYLDQLESWRHEMEEAVLAKAPLATGLAQFLVDYLADTARVRVEVGLYVGNVDNPQFLKLVEEWYSGLTAMLRAFMPEQAARALVIFADGVLLQAAQLQTAQLDVETLAWSISRLIGEHNA